MAAPLTADKREAGALPKGTPRLHVGLRKRRKAGVRAVLDLVGPVSLESQQGGIHPDEVVAGNAADLFDRTRVLLIDCGDDAVNLLPLFGQLIRTERRSTRERE